MTSGLASGTSGGGPGIDIALHAQHDPNFARSLERGSRLVACVPGSERVVTQLPRGNLYVPARLTNEQSRTGHLPSLFFRIESITNFCSTLLRFTWPCYFSSSTFMSYISQRYSLTHFFLAYLSLTRFVFPHSRLCPFHLSLFSCPSLPAASARPSTRARSSFAAFALTSAPLVTAPRCF